MQMVVVTASGMSFGHNVRLCLTPYAAEVITFRGVSETLKRIVSVAPVCVFVDFAVIAKGSGMNLCQQIRRSLGDANFPIVILGREQLEDEIANSFLAGGSEYISQPISEVELRARAMVLISRNSLNANNKYLTSHCPGHQLEFSPKRHELRINGNPVILTRNEYKIFAEIFEKKGDLVPFEAVSYFLTDGTNPSVRTLNVHLFNLKKKLGPFADSIERVRGIGLRWKNSIGQEGGQSAS